MGGACIGGTIDACVCVCVCVCACDGGEGEEGRRMNFWTIRKDRCRSSVILSAPRNYYKIYIT